MEPTLRKLFQMFYPLTRDERRKWAGILSSAEEKYLSALAVEASEHGLEQRASGGVVAWLDRDGRELMLLFRLKDPGDLDAVRRVYQTISERDAPLAYAFVHQVADGEGTWDIFHMSRSTYLAHCNRVSGPGSEDESQ
jgi:hypothetical protein